MKPEILKSGNPRDLSKTAGYKLPYVEAQSEPEPLDSLCDLPTIRHYEVESGTSAFYIREVRNGHYVAKTITDTEADKDDAEFICRAVNSHYELVAACESALAQMTQPKFACYPPIIVEQLRAAILKAKGGAK